MQVLLRSVVWVFVFALSGSLFAQEADHDAAIEALRAKGGGFYPGGGTIFYTIRDVAILPDGASARLSGQILARIGGNKYLFGEFDRSVQTQSGFERVAGDRIVVEIDDDNWQGQVVTPSGSVEILGEVEREGDAVTVKVNELKVRSTAQINAVRAGDSPIPTEWLELRQRRLRTDEQQTGSSPESLNQRPRRLRMDGQQGTPTAPVSEN